MSPFNPPPPSEILREDILQELNLTPTELAQRLGQNPVELAEVLANRRPLGAELALALEKAGFSTAETWLALQKKYECWQRQHRPWD